MPGDLSKIYQKIGTTRAHIRFVTRCTKYDIIPDGLMSKPRFNSRKSSTLEIMFGKKRRRELLNSLHAKLFYLQFQADTDLNLTNHSEDDLKKIRDREYRSRSKIHDKKFAKLRAKQKKDKLGREFIMDAVINRSSRDITENEHRVLARGFKFRPSLKTIPIEEYIIATESILKTAKLTDEEATRLRVTVALELERMQRLEKRRPTKPNMTAKEWAAVKELQKDEKITIVSADKGDNSVVMDYIHDGIELEEGKPVIMDYPTCISIEISRQDKTSYKNRI